MQVLNDGLSERDGNLEVAKKKFWIMEGGVAIG